MTPNGRARLQDDSRKEVRARLLIEDFEQLADLARENERSLEGRVRWMLRQMLLPDRESST
jgi:hypothetical protein